mmetsp:Transcript_9038/g.22918  ORF Transcript_9038/g.22918 Transcript_9038/m.22918 type:complete len:219 (-) Transcript_9038:465-1121(-)
MPITSSPVGVCRAPAAFASRRLVGDSPRPRQGPAWQRHVGGDSIALRRPRRRRKPRGALGRRRRARLVRLETSTVADAHSVASPGAALLWRVLLLCDDVDLFRSSQNRQPRYGPGRGRRRRIRAGRHRLRLTPPRMLRRKRPRRLRLHGNVGGIARRHLRSLSGRKFSRLRRRLRRVPRLRRRQLRPREKLPDVFQPRARPHHRRGGDETGDHHRRSD